MTDFVVEFERPFTAAETQAIAADLRRQRQSGAAYLLVPDGVRVTPMKVTTPNMERTSGYLTGREPGWSLACWPNIGSDEYEYRLIGPDGSRQSLYVSAREFHDHPAAMRTLVMDFVRRHVPPAPAPLTLPPHLAAIQQEIIALAKPRVPRATAPVSRDPNEWVRTRKIDLE